MHLSWFTRLPVVGQLALLLALLLPAFWSLLFLDLSHRRDLLLEQSRVITDNLVLAFSEEVKTSVQAIDYSLLDLRDEWMLRPHTFEEAVLRWRQRIDGNALLQVGVIDARGALRYTSITPKLLGTDLSDREHYRAHRNSVHDRLFISKPVLGRVSQRWSVQFTRPIFEDGGAFAGVMVISVDPDYFSRFYRALDLGEGGTIVLARGAGEVLVQSPMQENTYGKRVVDLGFYLEAPGPGGALGVRKADSHPASLTVSRHLPQGDLLVLIDRPLGFLLQDYRDQRRSYFVAGAVGSLLLAMICYAVLSRARAHAATSARIAESAERWKYALEGTGVWDMDVKSGTVTFSRQWKQQLGYEEDELFNHADVFAKLTHPDDLAHASSEYHAHLNGTHPSFRTDLRLQTKEGEWRWFLCRGQVVERNARGEPLRVVGIHTDITSRKIAEHELRESLEQLALDRQRMRIILENSYDAFVAVDAREIITDWNAQAERTFGWTAAEAIGMTLAELIVPPEHRAAHHAGFLRFVQHGAGANMRRRMELTAQRRDGRLVPVELTIASMPVAQGVAAHAFIRDISDRIAAEDALEEAGNALHHAQKLEAVGKLTGGVAHDFNNILQIIGGSLELLQLQLAENPAALSRVSMASAAVTRGAKLSSQLLAFARRQPLQPKVVNINRMIASMHDMLRQALGESVEVGINTTGPARTALVDPHQLENVILNLAINASHAMAGQGRLSIVVSDTAVAPGQGRLATFVTPGEYVAVAVADTGCGMSDEVRQRAFEPFFTTRPEGLGTGLGLSMAYGFVKQSGGHIDIDSLAGQGTTITIYLPRSREAETVCIEQPIAEARGQGETILVVEDDLQVQDTVVATLRRLGYQVLTADNGEQALDHLRSGQPIDLLFTDVALPGKLRGPELALAATALDPNLAVLYTSGYTAGATNRSGILPPDMLLLKKPYQLQELTQGIRQALASRKVVVPEAT